MHNSVRNSNCVLRNAREHPDDVHARARNPVILLTARELFGQFKLGGYGDQYGPKANYAHMVAIRGDLQELADFTQQVYLDMQPYHEWYQEKHKGEVAEDSGGAGGRCHVVSRFSKSR